MNKSKISIAQKTLKLLEKNSWHNISFTKIINKKEQVYFKNKHELLVNINRYFDYLLKKNLIDLEESSPKDMIFEIIMARLDILNGYRNSILNLTKFFSSNPQYFIKLIPSFVESVIFMSSLGNIKIDGVKGAMRVKSIFVLYIFILNSWYSDNNESLEKTMTNLDKYLTNLDKILNLTK